MFTADRVFLTRMWRFEAQQNRYGGYLYIRDEDGYYWCFFKSCGQKMHSNFANHIELHELNGDDFDDEYRKLAMHKYRGRPEATLPNALRVKSALARTRQEEIPLSTCLGVLERLCFYCDSVPLVLSECHEFSVRPSRCHYSATLSNLVFDPLLAKAYAYVSQVENALDLGAVYRNLVQHQYKDAEAFAMDVRHALNFARLASTSPTVFAPLGFGEFRSHLRVLSTGFSFLMEYERLKLRFRNAEKKLFAKYSQLELPYAALIEIIQELIQNSLAVYFLDPNDVVSDECPFLIHSTPTFYNTITPSVLTDVYDDLKNGKFAARPSLLFARAIRAFFLHILLWNERNSDLYINADRLANVFEGLLEKAYQNGLRANQSDFRYTARDDHSRLLVWDPRQRAYYVEYFETPSEWDNADRQRTEHEAKEAQLQAAEDISVPAPGQEDANRRPITRFAKPPQPMPTQAPYKSTFSPNIIQPQASNMLPPTLSRTPSSSGTTHFGDPQHATQTHGIVQRGPSLAPSPSSRQDTTTLGSLRPPPPSSASSSVLSVASSGLPLTATPSSSSSFSSGATSTASILQLSGPPKQLLEH